MPLTKIQLDLIAAHGCESPGCNHEGHDTIFMHARCHVRGGVEVSYQRGTGVLQVACAKCHKIIGEIKVAND